MPRIDFYILPIDSESARLHFACRLIEKAYKQKHRIYIHAENENEAHQLDELLWTYRDDSFLPHHLSGEGSDPPPPIQIGFQTVPLHERDILINLNMIIPEFYQQFSRVIELVIPSVQNVSREHFKLYRAALHDIHTHKLETTEV